MDKSTDLNGADAIAYIETLESAESIREFIADDERKTVLSAAEKRIKALSSNIASGNGESESVATVSISESTNILTCDTWLYSEDHEPRIFNAGEVVPEGWTTNPKGIVGNVWNQDISGKWERSK